MEMGFSGFITWSGVTVDSDDFAMDDLSCPENSMSLAECSYSVDSENCSAGEGVYIECGGKSVIFQGQKFLSSTVVL